jgi:hypothetical protein
MLINGVAVDQLEFNGPNDFANLTDTNPDTATTAVTRGYGVFHPDAGGATLVTAPPEVMENKQPGQWLFNSAYQVTNIGTTVLNASSANEVLAFLPGVALAACRRLNKELGITSATSGWADADNNGVPGSGVTFATIPDAAANMVSTSSGTVIPGIATGANATHTIGGAFSGQAYGCIDADDTSGSTNAGKLVYYHVLVDR